MIDFYKFSCEKVGEHWFVATVQLKRDGCKSHSSGSTPEEAIREAFRGIEKAQKVFDLFK